MKILDNNNYIEVRCNHCQSALGIHYPDIHYQEMAHHGSPYTTKCAACQRITDIPPRLVPQRWKAALDD